MVGLVFRVSIVLLGLNVLASTAWSGGGTTMFQDPPTPAEILEALGEKPRFKTRGGVKTRAIVVHDDASAAFAQPSQTSPESPEANLADVQEPEGVGEPSGGYATDVAVSKPRPAKPARKQGATGQPKKNKVAFPLTFEINSATLTPEARSYIDSMAEALQQKPELTLHISGHTDISGGDTVNRPLSLRRAEAVKQYLVAGRQIDSSRLSISGEGSSQLLIKNNSRAEENRRVEFVKNN